MKHDEYGYDSDDAVRGWKLGVYGLDGIKMSLVWLIDMNDEVEGRGKYRGFINIVLAAESQG